MSATYLNVPFREKDEAKALGARWDPLRRSWYVPAGAALEDFARWLPATARAPAPAPAPTATATPAPAPAPRRNRGADPGLVAPADLPDVSLLVPVLGDVPDAHPDVSPDAFPDAPLAVRDPVHMPETALLARDPASAGALTHGSPRGVPLSRLLTAVSRVVAGSFADPVWVTAEVVHVRLAPQGHVYLELSERNAGGQLIAKASGMIWASTARSILPAFEKATQATLAAGIKLLVRVRPVFKAQYGFSLEIDAIDPAYTLGDLEARKREIRERLRREGLFDLNRGLPAPWDYNTVIVIAPEGAAGLGDFREEAQRLERHGLCLFVHAFSRFQGEGAAAGILAAAAQALAGHHDVDALVIIRGGGAVNDLAWLNDYALARFICECPVPVLTGIGHERDSTTLDEVAHRSFDTPSKVILGIEQRIRQRADEARDAMGRIAALATHAVAAARSDTGRLFGFVREAAGDSVHRGRQRCERLLADTRLNADRHRQQARADVRAALVCVTTEARQAIVDGRRALPRLRQQILVDSRNTVRETASRLQQAVQSVGRDARRQLAQARQMSEALVREVAGQGPAKTLGRGFALVRDPEGRPLTRAGTSARAGTVQIQFQDGRLAADVRPDSLISEDDEPAGKAGTNPKSKTKTNPKTNPKTRTRTSPKTDPKSTSDESQDLP